jgi:ADP-ribose pyrophosphatase YjhB (NUDIX family)
VSEKIVKLVATVIIKENKVLLIKKEICYSLPAGKVEEGETWEEAAKRECVEESGIKPLKLIKLPTYYEADIKGRRYGCWSFYCPEYEGNLKGSDEGDPVWVEIDKIKNLNLWINVEKMVEEAMNFL